MAAKRKISIEERIDREQKALRRRAIGDIQEAQRLLTSAAKYLEDTPDSHGIFPMYIDDIESYVRVVGLLAARHVCLEELKISLDRRRDG